MTAHDFDPRPELTQRRAERLSALLADAYDADAAARASAARMRPVVRAAAHRAAVAHRRTRLLRAAAIVLVIAGLGAVPPARAWVVEHARQLAAMLGVVSSESPPAAVTAGAPADGAVRYSFRARGPVLAVHIDAAAGTLVIRRTPAAAASVEAIDAPGTRVVVLPDGVRLSSDDAADAARFILDVPAAVRQVTLVRADGTTSTHTVSAGETRVPL
jgi:hypothetical protein